MSDLFAAIHAQAIEGRAEYAKDPRFAKLLPLIEPLSPETVVMMLMDCEDALADLAAKVDAIKAREMAT